VEPIKPPPQYAPEDYLQASQANPLGSLKLTQALRHDDRLAPHGAALLAPELRRRKEPLEDYDLDALTMVGSLHRGGQTQALVQADKLLYLVRAGQHLGPNYGLATKITENQIVLREIVQNSTGQWIERPAVLPLQEKTK
jgi:type IV pilus assembly protein PilP